MTITPQDQNETKRWRFTREARLILQDNWEQLLVQYLATQLNTQRLDAIGRPSSTLNLFRDVVSQLAIQYYKPLTINHAEATTEQLSELGELIQTVSLHSYQQTNSEYVIGLRESFICIKLSVDDNGKNVVRLEVVAPDTVQCITDDSGQLVYFRREGRWLIPNTREYVEGWEEYSLLDSIATYRIYKYTDGTDLTNVIYPEGFLGLKEYPFYDAEDIAFIPVAKYRARTTNDEFNPYHFSELVEGTLQVGALWTYWNRAVRDASWPQRWVLNAQPAGLSNTHDGLGAPFNTATVSTDPTSILVFTSEDGKQVNIGQYEPGGDPEKIQRSIEAYQASIVRCAGIHSSDLEDVASNQSGIAISLKKASQRRLAQQYVEEFRKADLDLLYKLVTVYNEYINEGADLPTTGYTLQYNLLPASPEEMQSEINVSTALVNAGFLSKVDVYMQLNPGMSRKDAEAHLIRIKQENTQF